MHEQRCNKASFMVSRKIFHPLAIPVSTSEHLISLAPRVDESRGKEAEKQSYCIAVVGRGLSWSGIFAGEIGLC
jgi:hypothetical protein